MPQLRKADWNKIHIQYVHGGVRIAELAQEFGVKEDTIYKRMQRDGWSNERSIAEQQALLEAKKERAAKRVQELSEFNEADLKISRAVRALVAKNLTDPKLKLGDLRTLAQTAEAAQRIGRLALNASTDNVGLGGTGGEGPVTVTNVSRDEYLAARKEIIEDY